MEISDLAYRLYLIIRDRPYRCVVSELVRDLGSTKTAIIRASHELEEAGLIVIEEV